MPRKVSEEKVDSAIKGVSVDWKGEPPTESLIDIDAERASWTDFSWLGELDTFAMALIAKHGDGVHVHVAAKIGEYAKDGDQGGIDFWKDIARRVDQILRGSEQ